MENFTNVEDRLRRFDLTRPTSRLNPSEFDSRIPAGFQFQASKTTVGGVTKVLSSWTAPDYTNIDRFEIWVSGVLINAPQQAPYLIASTTDAPAVFTLVADIGAVVTLYLRTVMKNGLTNSLSACPTVSFEIV